MEQSVLKSYRNHQTSLIFLSKKYNIDIDSVRKLLDVFFGSEYGVGIKYHVRKQHKITIRGLGTFYPTLAGKRALERKKHNKRLIHNKKIKKYRIKRQNQNKND